MTEEFKEKIKAYEHPLFYNSTGSPEAYKLCVRHLFAAMSAGLEGISTLKRFYILSIWTMSKLLWPKSLWNSSS